MSQSVDILCPRNADLSNINCSFTICNKDQNKILKIVSKIFFYDSFSHGKNQWEQNV